MRNWKNWLLPLLTCLMVVGLALLPLRLSVLEDEKLTGVVHCEDLGENSNFPAKPPDLPGRVCLLAQRESTPEALAIMDQALEKTALAAAAPQAQAALRQLEAAGALPQGLSGRMASFSGNRVYLRDRADLSSAAFLEINAYEASGDGYFWMYLDVESGKLLGLELSSHLLVKQPTEPLAAGRAFLEVLGFDWEGRGSSDHEAVFFLPDAQTLYWCICDKGYLRFYPSVDWEALDEAAGQSDVDVSFAMRSALGYDA